MNADWKPFEGILKPCGCAICPKHAQEIQPGGSNGQPAAEGGIGTGKVCLEMAEKLLAEAGNREIASVAILRRAIVTHRWALVWLGISLGFWVAFLLRRLWLP